VLTCQSKTDIENINLIATLLSHHQTLAYWKHLGGRFVADVEALLRRQSTNKHHQSAHPSVTHGPTSEGQPRIETTLVLGSCWSRRLRSGFRPTIVCLYKQKEAFCLGVVIRTTRYSDVRSYARKLMRRRIFIAFLGSVVAAWPRVARGQQSAGMRHIGVLVGNASSVDDQLGQKELQPFQDALRQAGWIEGKTIQIDYRYGAGDPAKIETAAAELVRLAPNVIYAISLKAVQAVSQKTLTIPIVFSLVADPIGMGVVTNLQHPGGNVTGFAVLDPAASGKWLQLLKEIAPSVSRVGVLYNPDVAPYAAAFVSAGTNAAGQSLKLLERPVRNDADIEAAAMSIGDEPNGALWVIADPFTTQHGDHIIGEALRFRLPSIFGNSLMAERGGLMAYGFAVDAYMKQPAKYIDRILKGDKPGDLPIKEPVKYELVINLKTAEMLGLTVPTSMQLLADKLIK
jgi:putative tryptophan/tyrosine transport system substrate-binding protein